jgi:formylglycine-generating enzyme required for sulfatase activity
MRKMLPVCALLAASSVVAAVAVLSTQRAQALQPPPAAQPGCQDRDGDGFGIGCQNGPDCNDRDRAVHPGQAEICNGRDDDCNALVDDARECSPPAIDKTPVHVAAARFLMGSAKDEGSADEHPRHAVRVSGFYLDRTEITNARYQACVRTGSCKAPALPGSHLRQNYYENPEFADYPVVFVDHERAQDFCRFAGGRLPTEAEWELAARGPEPSARTYPWGDDAPDCMKANLGGPGSCIGDTDRVGRRPAGAAPSGALDMAGNVWEWTSDFYDAHYYEKSPLADPKGPASGTLRVMRGGCWLSGADSLRVSCRKAELPATWAYNVGFRCAYPEGGK